MANAVTRILSHENPVLTCFHVHLAAASAQVFYNLGWVFEVLIHPPHFETVAVCSVSCQKHITIQRADRCSLHLISRRGFDLLIDLSIRKFALRRLTHHLCVLLFYLVVLLLLPRVHATAHLQRLFATVDPSLRRPLCGSRFLTGVVRWVLNRGELFIDRRNLLVRSFDHLIVNFELLTK